MVQQLDINGTPVRVLFGMDFIEKFSNEIVDNNEKGILLNNSETTAAIVWFGHLNWCRSFKVPVEIKRQDVEVGIEMIYHEDNEKDIQALTDILQAYSNSRFGKIVAETTAKAEQEAKKKIAEQHGLTLESSPLVS